MCRVDVRSYENNGVQNHLVVLNTPVENRIIIEANPDNIGNTYRKIKCMKIYIFLNLIYIGYLHYENYKLWGKCGD
tara:strand:- start:1046 stop:1273 length:228 start_codon:yes stop_codon:yes gene_type:complete